MNKNTTDDFDGINHALWNDDITDSDVLFEQYKLYIESAENISDRRHQANAFFLSVNVGLIGILTTFGVPEDGSVLGYIWVSIASVGGIAFSIYWRRLVNSYRQLNSGKFNIIHRLETRLPARLYLAEWQALGEGDSHLYTPFTHIENRIPLVFILLYSLVFISSILSATLILTS
jgi:hypothetical protein